MSENKTKPTNQTVESFIASLPVAQQRADSMQLVRLFREVTGEPGTMWGSSIIGFGSYHYTYASGREGDWAKTGFAPRKNDLTIYLTYGFDGDAELMAKLGPHKTGKACLYIKRLDQIDQDVLKELIARSLAKFDEPGNPYHAITSSADAAGE